MNIFAKTMLLMLTIPSPLCATPDQCTLSYHDYPWVYEQTSQLCCVLMMKPPRIIMAAGDHAGDIYSDSLLPRNATIVIGKDLLDLTPRCEMIALIAHELIHIHRYHYLKQLVSAGVVGGAALCAYYLGALSSAQQCSTHTTKLGKVVIGALPVYLIYRLIMASIARGYELQADRLAATMLFQKRGLIEYLTRCQDYEQRRGGTTPQEIERSWRSVEALSVVGSLAGIGKKVHQLYNRLRQRAQVLFSEHPDAQTRIDYIRSGGS